jgi:invasion protein IalB
VLSHRCCISVIIFPQATKQQKQQKQVCNNIPKEQKQKHVPIPLDVWA